MAPKCSHEEITSISHEIQLWLKMMNFMLECAEKSMKAMESIKDTINFSNDDLEKFTALSSVLEGIVLQLSFLDQDFLAKKPPPCLCNHGISSQSQSLKKEANGNFKFESNILTKRRIRSRDACFCKLLRKNRKRDTVVCSSMGRPHFVSDRCEGCSALNEELKHEQSEQDDDNHPNIIKNGGGLHFQTTGVGYEVFYAMRRYPNVIAQYIEATDATQTFSEVLRSCISVAVKLRKKGFNEDHIIGLCVTNNEYSSVAYLAGLFLGCQMNCLDVSFRLSEIVDLLTMVSPSIMFVQSEKIPDIKEALERIGTNIEIIALGGEVAGHETIREYLNATDEEVDSFKPYRVDSLERICVILFSSGTAGLPKGICLTHLNMLNQLVLSTISGDYGQVFMTFTSLYWISGALFLLATIVAGVSRVVPLPLEFSRVYTLIDRYKINCLFLGPFECIMMTKTPKPPDVDTSSLTCLITGGASMKEIIYRELRKIFPGCMVNQVYGQTEVGGTITRFAANLPREVALCDLRPLSCGVPFGGFWYKVVDEPTGHILGPFQRGELYLKSDSMIMKGYYNKDSSEYFENGWLRTGDMVYYDNHHCFYIVDRLRELIRYRAWHIAPTTLEQILTTHPAVSRAIVIGIPHDEDNEHPMALILLNPTVDPTTVDLKEIAEFVNKQVEDKKQLRGGVKIIKKLLLTETGKVKRMAMRDAILRGEDL